MTFADLNKRKSYENFVPTAERKYHAFEPVGKLCAERKASEELQPTNIEHGG